MQYRYVAPLSPSGSSPDGGAKNVMPLNLIALPMRGRLKRSDASRRNQKIDFYRHLRAHRLGRRRQSRHCALERFIGDAQLLGLSLGGGLSI